MLLQQIQLVIAVICFLVFIAFAPSAEALVINVNPLEPDKSRLEVLFTEIVTIEERVYTLDPEAGEIEFGDGISGSRLPTGEDNVVATYRYGAGNTAGVIVNLYPLAQDLLPFLIPFSDFVGGNNEEDVSFIIAGVTSLRFEYSRNGILITAAEANAVPEPTALMLLISGLIGIGYRRHWGKKAA